MIYFQLIIMLVIVFGVLIFLIWKISAQNTKAAVERLDAVYQDLLAKQKEVNAKIEEGEKEYQEKKEKSEKEAVEIKAKATEEMRLKREEMLKQAKTQAEEILGRAKDNVDEHYKKVELEAKARVVDIASEILIDALGKRLLLPFHMLIFEDFLERAKGFDLTKIGPHIDTVTVKTPYPLDDQQKAKIKSLIAGKVNRTFKVDEIIDEQLIAGVLLEFGTLLLEGSVQSSIKDAREALKEKMRFQD